MSAIDLSALAVWQRDRRRCCLCRRWRAGGVSKYGICKECAAAMREDVADRKRDERRMEKQHEG